jgi:hypothetical protein
MVGLGSNAMLLEKALFDMHPALATGKTAAADTLNVHPHLAGSVQHRRPFLNMSATARRHKDNQVFCYFAVGTRHPLFSGDCHLTGDCHLLKF